MDIGPMMGGVRGTAVVWNGAKEMRHFFRYI